MKRRSVAGIMAGAAVLGCLAGCATRPDGTVEYKRTGLGAAAGAIVGAGAGALFGGGKGAAIGAAGGALVGGGVGNYMDRQAAALKKTIPQANVERRGEKIYVTLPSGILFDKNRDFLRPEAMEALGKAAASLRASQTNIVIEGHTDISGSDAVNIPLSQRRADRVRDYLIAQGVPTARLASIGYGSRRPAFPNDTEGNRALNRRVQLEISPSSTLKAQNP